MALPDAPDRPPSPIEPFLTPLIERDPGGRSWLGPLLRATPAGAAALGGLAENPGYLSPSLTVRGISGRFACFEYPVGPPRELLEWFVEHPDRLVWPDRARAGGEAAVLRRALLDDDPPGARVRAQGRARELMQTRSVLSREWWRFEEVGHLDCVLMTERLVLTIEGGGGEPLPPATEWYPVRTRLVRALEAARGLAGDGRRWASILMTDEPLDDATPEALARSLDDAAPHLDDGARRELAGAYLGNITWREAAAAVAPAAR